MLCEKCHRQQTEWSTLCEDCEKEEASVARWTDIVRAVKRLKWFALWMTGDFVFLALIWVVLARLCGAPPLMLWGLLSLILVCVVIGLSEWWLWRGYASRLQKGAYRDVAAELLDHPKGFWKREMALRQGKSIRYRRRMLGGTILYVYALRDLFDDRQTLEMLIERDECGVKR